jgi:hypothetical protein
VFTLSSIRFPRLDSRDAHAWGVQIIGHTRSHAGRWGGGELHCRSGAVALAAGAHGVEVDVRVTADGAAAPAAMAYVLGNMRSPVPVGAGG